MAGPMDLISQLSGAMPEELDPNMLAQMGFALPGQTDDMLLSMPSALGGFDMTELMSLMNPPPASASNGVRMPEANQTAVVRPAGRMSMPRQQTAKPATGRNDLQQKQRAAQKMEIRRGQQQRASKKGSGY